MNSEIEIITINFHPTLDIAILIFVIKKNTFHASRDSQSQRIFYHKICKRMVFVQCAEIVINLMRDIPSSFHI